MMNQEPKEPKASKESKTSRYSKEVSHQGITKAKEVELIGQFQRFKANASFELLAESLMPLLVSMSRFVCATRPALDFDDAMQSALRGLWFAIMDFDPKYNTRLVTRAYLKIKTQHRMLVNEHDKFYLRGELITGTESGEASKINQIDDSGHGEPGTEQNTESGSEKYPEKIKRALRKAVKVELTVRERVSLAALALTEDSRNTAENKYGKRSTREKIELRRAIKKLKVVMGKYAVENQQDGEAKL